jgi:RNA polymerase sigma-70 factor (ECF subfamily)
LASSREALERLYDAFAAKAYGFVLRMVREPAWAEDLMQEAFLRVADRLEGLRDPAAARGYLWRSLANLAVDGLRRRRRSPVRTEVDGIEPVARGADAGTSAEAQDTADAVHRAVDDLPERERAAVLLRVTAGLTFREVGDALGMTDRGAARLVNAGLDRLRRRLSASESFEDLLPRGRSHA